MLSKRDRKIGNVDGLCDYNSHQCVVDWQHGEKGKHGIVKDPCKGSLPKDGKKAKCFLEDWEIDGKCVGPGNTWGACESNAQADRGRNGQVD